MLVAFAPEDSDAHRQTRLQATIETWEHKNFWIDLQHNTTIAAQNEHQTRNPPMQQPGKEQNSSKKTWIWNPLSNL